MSSDTPVIDVDGLKVGAHMVRSYREEIKSLQARIDELELALKDVAALIDESDGVAGLHLNGDLAPWSELLSEGQFAEWLVNFNAALSTHKGGEG